MWKSDPRGGRLAEEIQPQKFITALNKGYFDRVRTDVIAPGGDKGRKEREEGHLGKLCRERLDVLCMYVGACLAIVNEAHSKLHPDFDSAWFRGFDYGRWNFRASNSGKGRGRGVH